MPGFTAEDKKAALNRVKDDTAHNRIVEAEMTFRAISPLSM